MSLCPCSAEIVQAIGHEVVYVIAHGGWIFVALVAFGLACWAYRGRGKG